MGAKSSIPSLPSPVDIYGPEENSVTSITSNDSIPDSEYPHSKYLHLEAKVKSRHKPGLKLKKTKKDPSKLCPDDISPSGGSPGDLTTSPMKIRQQRILELEESRPQVSQKQAVLITDTWLILSADLADLGSEIFERMFSSYPDVKGAFGPFGSLNTEDERYSKEIRAHGKRVLGTIEMVISNRNDQEQIIKNLHELGNKHITFNARSEFMDILAQMFLFAVEPALKDHWTPEVEEAWAQLLHFIIHVMREAMYL